MLLTTLILVPFIGLFLVSTILTYNITNEKTKILKIAALLVTIIDLIISLIMFILYDSSNKNFQFIQEHYDVNYYEFYLGVDGLSIYFALLTTLIMPISIISNWKSINNNTRIFLLIMLLLEASLLTVFLVLDILMFYIFFESILAPLFILIGLYGSNEKVRASFYFFLYTLLGSLFMLLSIVSVLSLIGSTSFDILSKTNFLFISQILYFIGIFIAFAVKTPVIYLNSWLLKAHVESPLSGSIILAAIVLKLSLYGIFRLILVLLPKAFIYYTFVIFVIGVLTIIYASLSTLRTVDVKELIAYSSVSHAAVYLLAAFSNVFQGIQGAISLGLAHGFVSSGLFTCAGGVLYDRSSTRLITYYRGLAQIMPIFCILFFILSLGNCGAPLTLNFIGEFLSLYGVFERLPMAGVLASSSIVFSAAYTIFMFNRIAFAGSYFKQFWDTYIPDINKREYTILLSLVLFTVFLGIYPAIILDGLHYSTYCVLYSISSFDTVNFDTLFSDCLFEENNLWNNELNNSIIFSLLFSFIIFSGIISYIMFMVNNDNNHWHIVTALVATLALMGFYYFPEQHELWRVFVEVHNDPCLWYPVYSEITEQLPSFIRNFCHHTLYITTFTEEVQIYQFVFHMPNDINLLIGFVDNIIDSINQMTTTYETEMARDYDDMSIDEEVLLDQIKTALSLLKKVEVIILYYDPSYVSRPDIDLTWAWVADDEVAMPM